MTVNKREERIELTAVDKFSTVIGQAQGQFKGLGASIDTVKNALGAIGVTLGAGAMAQLYLDTVKATAALDDMAEQTGASVEELSKIQAVAKIGGHEFNGVTDAIGKMIKGLKGADEEGQAAGKALEFLGVKAKDANGRFRDGAVIMQEVARELAKYEDGGNKVALVQDLLSKSGARYLSLLKDMAEEGSIAARVTAEQAAEAEKFEKAMNRVSLAFEDARRSAISPYVSDMTNLLEQMSEGIKIFGGFSSAIYNIGVATDPFKSLTENAQALREELEHIQRVNASWFRIPGVVSITGAGVTIGPTDGREERVRKRLQFLQLMERQQALANSGPGDYDARDIRLRTPQSLYYESPASKKPKAARGRTGEDVLLEQSGWNRQGIEDLQRLRELYDENSISLQQYQIAIQGVIEKQQFHKDLLAQQAEATKRFTEELQRQVEAQEKQDELYASFHASTGQRLRDIEFETTLVGADNAVRERAVAFRQIEQDLNRAMVDATPATVDALLQRAAAMKESIGAAIDAKVAREKAHEASVAAAEEWKSEFKRQSESIERLLSDALMRGFEDGKGWARNFADTLKNLFKTLVLEPLIRPIAQAGAGAVLGSFGMNAGAAGGGGFGGLGGFNPISSFNGISSLFGATGGAASIAGLGAAGELAMLTGSGVASAGVAGGGLMAGLGTALPWVGGALAIGSMLGLFDEGGGPKQQEVIWNNGGSLGFGDANITSQDPAYYAAAQAATQRLRSQFTLEQLATVPRMQVTGEAGSDPFQLLGQLESQVTSALSPVLQQKQARTALMAAQDPKGYWAGELATLQGDLGTSADSVEEWRMAFLAALDEPLSADVFAKWQALGAAIEGVSNAAGGAASSLSTSGFRTLVDYRRAVRLAGGVPQFAAGGEHAGGWRMVGERGSELEFTAPSAIVSHQEAKGLLDNREVVSQLEALRGENRAMATALARNTGEVARLARRWENNGIPVRALDPTEPILVRETPA